MIKKEIKGVDVSLFYEKLENGLEVFLIPYSNRKNYYIEYGVKYGAKTVDFISADSNKRIKVPKGVAHFLEHKMFEQENGEDPFSYFSQSGSDANASTSYDMTSYTVEGIKNIEENLEYLLNYVNSPFFTDENVNKEKGIIIEELNMYKDQPESRLYEESNKALFVKHPMRIDIGGTPSSVNKINKEILYECYNTFYQPNNMFLVISGKFDCKSVMNIIKNNKKLNSKKQSKKIECFNVNEPLKVKTKEKEIKIKNMIKSKSIMSIKYPMKKLNGHDTYKYEVSLGIYLYILFGMSSLFKEEVYKKELCSLFYSSSSIIDDYVIIEFLFESDFPHEIKERVIKCLRNYKITKEEIERVKKVKLSLEIMNSDKPSKMLNSVIKDIIDYNEVLYNKIDIIKDITLEDVKKVQKDIIIDNYSIVIGISK